MVVPDDTVSPCDMILISGSCVVNEAMLTGESAAAIKYQISVNNQVYDSNQFDSIKKHTIFSGTKIIQSRPNPGSKCYGLVTKTGFITLKGDLVREILFPPKVKSSFYTDSLIFVGVMIFIFGIAFGSIIKTLVNSGFSNQQIAFKLMDMSTIAVPPALPTCMSVGVAFAISRLKKKQIFCISPQRINISAMI